MALAPYACPFARWQDAYAFLQAEAQLNRGHISFMRRHHGAVKMKGGELYATTSLGLIGRTDYRDSKGFVDAW